MNKKLKKIEIATLIFVFVVTIIGGTIFGFITSEIKNYSGIDNLKKFQPSMPTRIYDLHGELISELFHEKRDLVAYKDIPQSVINSFLSAEDKDFFEHFGINPVAILRAMGKNLSASAKRGRLTIVQGGSTITQQLAKRLFTQSEKTVGRKALEAILALQIEKKFSKEEILEMYFNQIFLGHGCYGISAAAKFYFDKDVRDLNVAEGSVLAALPSRPNGFSPLKYPKIAFGKHKDTLRRMVENGFLSKEESKKVYETFWPKYIDHIKLKFPTKTALSRHVNRAPYFTDYVRQILLSRFGEDVVYNEGLDVYTTLDLKRQEQGEKLLKDGVTKQDKVSSHANAYYSSAVDRSLVSAYNTMRVFFNLSGIVIKQDIETKFKKKFFDNLVDSADILTLLTGSDFSNKVVSTSRKAITSISTALKVEGALIAIEPKTGYITTMVGGSEFNVSNQYNRAVQARRQPGSSFKPFVYGAGIESKRINAGTALSDAPIADIDASGGTWSPGNYGGTFSGLVSIRRALAASINIISVRIYDIMGPDNVIKYASKMLKVPETRFNPNPSLSLGTAELTPFELANAYAIYANKGKDVIPFAIRYVEDRDGNELLNIEEEVGNIIAAKELDGSIQVIPEGVAFIMTSLMRGVIDRGTANDQIRNKAGFKKEAAGKTGTTSNWTDAWFCGYTNDLAAVVWVGYDRPFMSLGKHQAGSAVAGPIWANYMNKVYERLPDPKFPKAPRDVYRTALCKHTGLRPLESCPKIGEYMYRGSGPRGVCDGKHYKMKSVLDMYMEKEGLAEKDEE